MEAWRFGGKGGAGVYGTEWSPYSVVSIIYFFAKKKPPPIFESFFWVWIPRLFFYERLEREGRGGETWKPPPTLDTFHPSIPPAFPLKISRLPHSAKKPPL